MYRIPLNITTGFVIALTVFCSTPIGSVTAEPSDDVDVSASASNPVDAPASGQAVLKENTRETRLLRGRLDDGLTGSIDNTKQLASELRGRLEGLKNRRAALTTRLDELQPSARAALNDALTEIDRKVQLVEDYVARSQTAALDADDYQTADTLVIALEKELTNVEAKLP